MVTHLDTPLGLLIRRQLQKKKISQDSAAKQIGISRQGLGKILSGKTNLPDIDLLLRISFVIGISEKAVLRAALDGAEVGMCSHSELLRTYPRDEIAFVSDVTVPDMSLIMAGSAFTKKWAIQNTGDFSWRNRRLRCMDDQYTIAKRGSAGELIDMVALSLRPLKNEIDVPDASPGSVVTLAVDFIAPSHPCITFSTWKMVDEGGNLCFPELPGVWCLVKIFDL